MSAINKLNVKVDSIHFENRDVLSMKLVNPNGGVLPEFAAGSHIDLHLDNGLIRQYSLCGPTWEREYYLIGILLESPSSGGSEYIHNNINTGDVLKISEPKHLFKINHSAKSHLLIAGGIGVTPILAMAYTLEKERADYTLHYCAKSSTQAPFLDKLTELVKHGNLHLHFDGGNPRKGLDLNATLQEYARGTHLYYCGPSGMMTAAAEACKHWPKDSVHYELFSAEGITSMESKFTNGESEFNIRLSRTGDVFSVPADQTIIEVLRKNGFEVDTSCEEGFCGTCLTRYTEGEPDHRDQILDDEDHEEYVLICCARSHTPELVLDM